VSSATRHPLHFRDGHLYLEVGGELWLLDTGAPVSFGDSENLAIGGATFRLESGLLNLDSARLSEFVGVECAGLLGGDVLSNFDIVLDQQSGSATLATDELGVPGHALPLERFLGIPIVPGRIGGKAHRFFFDTGAQLSYLDEAELAAFPEAGPVEDFHPSIGSFTTNTHQVDLSLGPHDFTLRCGSLPGLLGITLSMAGTSGILGNEILAGRVAGYFPRRGELVL
jgi:hypothetical protein